jgi:hypothetical protein
VRTFVVGLIASAAVCTVVTFAELIASRLGSIDSILLGATHMPPGAIGVLVVLLLANAAVGRVSKRLRLNRPELAVIYFMLVVSALISSFGLAAQLVPTLAGTNYFASPSDHLWRDNLFPHIPKWLVPWDPAGDEKQWVTQRFYEGLRSGERLPWTMWAGPLCAWLVLAFLLFFLMACVTTLFRRQWADNEKLTFPLVTLPMEMTADDARASFFGSGVMWLGLAVPTIVHLINGLHRSYPAVPEIPVTFLLNDLWNVPPWSGMIYTRLNLAFSVVGFSYFLPLDVSFSFWFFLVLARLADYIRLSMNHQLDLMPLYGGSRYYQGMQSAGAFVAIVVMMLHFARPHFRLVRDRVLGRPGSEKCDANEFMSYRAACFGGLIAFLLSVLWLKAAGMDPLVAAFMLGALVFVVMLVMTRCVAEVGLLMLEPAFRPMDLWAVFAPRASLGAANLSVMSLVQGVFVRNPRGPMPAFMDSMKGAEIAGAGRRSMAAGVALALVFASFFAVALQLWLSYTRGGMRMNIWFYHANPVIYMSETYGILRGDQPYRPDMAVWFGVGSIFTLFLYAMRSRLWWWPFHPLGYAMSCAWPTSVYWSSFFVGWLVKSMVQRYGGARVYQRFRPFFLGLILGEFCSAFLWALASIFFGVSTPGIPLG